MLLLSEQSLSKNVKSSNKRGMLLQAQLERSAEMTLTEAAHLAG